MTKTKHLEAYKYLRDLGFKVHVTSTLGGEGRSYRVSAYLADECKDIMAAGISCRVECGSLAAALTSAARLVRHNIEVLKECSQFAGEEFFKLTLQQPTN